MPLPDNHKVFAIKAFLKEYLDLQKDKTDEAQVTTQIESGVEMKGAQLWNLIFAIFMACLGLNVNSTAVVIGAMLISPLLGPITGIGFAVGINDFSLMKRSMKSYLITTAFSVVTATIYFSFSPLSEARSELLARTSPTIYDVFIALFGGLAGFVAISTKLRENNIIPGVAIATALMPPLCTAGFGIASGNLFYFLGACYLYFINSVFIGVATYLGAKQMKFSSKTFVDKNREKKLRRYIISIVLLTMIPSIYLTYTIVRTTLYQNEAINFINEQLNFEGTVIVNKQINPDNREIHVTLIGAEIPEKSISIAKSHLQQYKLRNTTLVIRQGFGAETLDMASLRGMVLEDFYKNNQLQIENQRKQIALLEEKLTEYKTNEELSRHLMPEVKILYPFVQSMSISHALSAQTDTTQIDTFTLVLIHTLRNLETEERRTMHDWLKARTQARKLQLIVQ